MWKLLTKEQQEVFPLCTADDVLLLFRLEMEKRDPSLVLVSVLLGVLEHSLTSLLRPDTEVAAQRLPANPSEDASSGPDVVRIPPLHLDTVFALLAKFCGLILEAVDVSQYDRCRTSATSSSSAAGGGIAGGATPRDLLKRVSDVIWYSLARTYHKDKPHIQSLYSFLIGNRLDCLGVSLAVMSACQVLQLNDVRLAVSEDHYWAEFGSADSDHTAANSDACAQRLTAEITWHGKDSGDKRGQEVICERSARSWLHADRHPIVCDRHMQLAVMVGSMNPTLGGCCDSAELLHIQRRLLWTLYDLKHLDRHPLTLGILAHLEFLQPTAGRPSHLQLHRKAIDINKTVYDNRLITPYILLGNVLMHMGNYEEAFETWADTSDALSFYDYSRDDEELYKELMEITIDHIPHIVKEVSSGISAHSILRSVTSYSQLLRFYDGLCLWEQAGSTPVLHIGWAKQMIGSVAKFEPDTRARLTVTTATTPSSQHQDDGDNGVSPQQPQCSLTLRSEKLSGIGKLLTATRLNTQAISLQLTAQSQVCGGGGRRRDEEDVTASASTTASARRSKRQRRDPEANASAE